ncbi:ureidoglycolate hydrolase [Myxozyma melibiosi]|uniref:Ureidoglycolate hydrolase n=1 Tax=Myxozyma melibiosi TaxID=54550 RepID=A0ABR1F962_9ASCO
MTIATISYSGKTVVAEELTPEAFAKFGSVISPRDQIAAELPAKGAGNIFTQGDVVKPEGKYEQSKFNPESYCSFNLQRFMPPATIDRTAKHYDAMMIERHPMSSQTFFPMGVDKEEAAYLVLATENDAEGMPDLSKLKAFVARGNQSVTYNAAVWHGSTCSLRDYLDMTMFMYTNGVAADITEVVQISGGLPVDY